MVDADRNIGDAKLAELAALADDSLAPRRRARVEATVKRSPKLRALLDEQRAALAAVRALDQPAPAALRAGVEALQRPAGRHTRRGLVLAGGFAAALAATVLLAVAFLPGAQPGPPTVLAAAGLAKRGASSPTPAGDRRQPNLLAATVAGVAFPDYEEKLGWRASGSRTDEVDGRGTQTVFYDRRGGRVAYTIVSGPALKWPAGARTTARGGVELRFLERGAQAIVTWLRGGRTCILSGDGVARGELLELAAWRGAGTVRF